MIFRIRIRQLSEQTDAQPYKAFPVTCGITFTYAGLKIDEYAAVLDAHDNPITGRNPYEYK